MLIAARTRLHMGDRSQGNELKLIGDLEGLLQAGQELGFGQGSGRIHFYGGWHPGTAIPADFRSGKNALLQ